jgi:hypothetical protein
MFDNIGEKISDVGKFICYSGITISCIIGLCICMIDDAFFAGVIICGVGSIVSWLSSLTIVGFGELITRTISIDEGLKATGIIQQAMVYGYPVNAAANYPNSNMQGQYMTRPNNSA